MHVINFHYIHILIFYSNVLLLHFSSYFLNCLFIFIFFYPFNFVIKIVCISRSFAFLTSVAIFSYFQNVWLVILQHIFNFHIAYFLFKISLKIHLIMLNMSVLYSFKILFLECVCWELFLFLWLYIFSSCCYLC